MKLHIVLVSVIVGMAFLSTGCSSKKVVAADNSGFFNDYTKIKSKDKKKVNLDKYTKIKVQKVKVIPAIPENLQNESQKKMYKEISEYLTAKYKKEVTKSAKYKLTDSNSDDTLILQSAVSTVEVHFDDKKWSQHSPIAMGLDVISFNAYMYEAVRILGESRFVDSISGDIVFRSRHIQKNDKIFITGDDLMFKDVKAAMDSWLAQVADDLKK